jgi:hypothetical protein
MRLREALWNSIQTRDLERVFEQALSYARQFVKRVYADGLAKFGRRDGRGEASRKHAPNMQALNQTRR